MKSLVDLLADLLLDCGRKSGAHVDRDVKTLRQRVEHEGDGFITITLPSYCKDFERSLADGRIGPGAFNSFKKLKSGIPAFLQGFLSNVFDQEGRLLSSPSVDCIRSVRQICLFGKKIVRPCSQARSDKAAAAYEQCDDGIEAPSDSQLNRVFKIVAKILADCLSLGEDFESSLFPTHGPGATRERIRGNAKWRFRRWHRRLQEVGFTYSKWGRGSQAEPEEDEIEFALERAREAPVSVDPEDEEPVRVVFVPKTLKTPRVIAVEPVCMQYAQQGLSRWLMGQIEKCPMTSGHVNFTRQDVNQSLAIQASRSGYYATIDMSEASDRVSLTHVSDLLESAPKLRDWVLACRSTRAQLPNGKTIPLKKFASMGSALCFPMESMVFYTIIIASRILRAGRFPTRRLVEQYRRDVYVYGDDLIVPADEAPEICADLESLGLKVNTAKSFWTGKFRESCGSDCYDGECVTPTYLRRDLPTSRRDVAGILSCVATCNQLFSSGYFRAAAALQEAVESILGRLPEVPANSPAIGWTHHSDVRPRRRWNKFLQRFEYLCWLPVSPRMDDPLEGESALAKCFRLIGRSSLGNFLSFEGLRKKTVDTDHLATSPTPYGVALERRWVELSL